MSFVTFQNSYYDLKASLEEAYSRLLFADLTVRVDRIPLTAARRIEQVPGVAVARVRTIQDVGLDLSGDQQGTARIISFPDDGAATRQRCLPRGGALALVRRRATRCCSIPSSPPRRRPRSTTSSRCASAASAASCASWESPRTPSTSTRLRSTGDLPSPGEFAVLFATEHVDREPAGPCGVGQRRRRPSRPGTDIDELVERLEDELEPYDVVMTRPARRPAGL